MAIKPNKTELKVLDLIKRARGHEAYAREMGLNVMTGLDWLEFVVKNGELRLQKSKG